VSAASVAIRLQCQRRRAEQRWFPPPASGLSPAEKPRCVECETPFLVKDKGRFLDYQALDSTDGAWAWPAPWFLQDGSDETNDATMKPIWPIGDNRPKPTRRRLRPLIKQRGSIMSAILTLVYREYCRACLSRIHRLG
jgi:hypothetical protein